MNVKRSKNRLYKVQLEVVSGRVQATTSTTVHDIAAATASTNTTELCQKEGAQKLWFLEERHQDKNMHMKENVKPEEVTDKTKETEHDQDHETRTTTRTEALGDVTPPATKRMAGMLAASMTTATEEPKDLKTVKEGLWQEAMEDYVNNEYNQVKVKKEDQCTKIKGENVGVNLYDNEEYESEVD